MFRCYTIILEGLYLDRQLRIWEVSGEEDKLIIFDEKCGQTFCSGEMVGERAGRGKVLAMQAWWPELHSRSPCKGGTNSTELSSDKAHLPSTPYTHYFLNKFHSNIKDSLDLMTHLLGMKAQGQIPTLSTTPGM